MHLLAGVVTPYEVDILSLPGVCETTVEYSHIHWSSQTNSTSFAEHIQNSENLASVH
jgi:hypothetical protein